MQLRHVSNIHHICTILVCHSNWDSHMGSATSTATVCISIGKKMKKVEFPAFDVWFHAQRSTHRLHPGSVFRCGGAQGTALSCYGWFGDLVRAQREVAVEEGQFPVAPEQRNSLRPLHIDLEITRFINILCYIFINRYINRFINRYQLQLQLHSSVSHRWPEQLVRPVTGWWCQPVLPNFCVVSNSWTFAKKV